MKALRLSRLATWCDGRISGNDVEVAALTIDSRNVAPGSLFVALRGERVDGHDFADAALAAGAAAVLVERPLPLAAPQLVVDDAIAALAGIASGLRDARDTTVLALTGSNGKTSVKTLAAAMLSRVAPTYANPGNRNNEIGMPLALIDQPEDVRFAIYEMGAGQPGDIDHLAAIAKPQVTLVNNIGPAHLERMGSLAGIAETKGAIHARLPADGTAVINADDAFAPWFEARLPPCRVLRFGIEASADVRAVDWRPEADGSRFRLVTLQGESLLRLPLPGRHNLLNALAATSLALAAGAPLSAIVESLQAATAVAGRLQAQPLPNGAELIDDSYNANPQSVAAAITVLAGRPGRRWLVLGDMRELGPDAGRLHAEAGARAREAGLDALWTIGEFAAEASSAFGTGARHFDSQGDLIDALRAALEPDVHCLVKGSRGSRMDRVVDALLGRGEASHAA
jgi:UDP-N-acetylmuramoyl-tripeptide--D-alanyl-D-alanine ligase